MKVLFDRRDPSAVLWPKRGTFEQLLEILNALLAGWLVIRLMGEDAEQGGHHAGGILIADSTGSVLGAIAAGFVLVPRLGVEASFAVVMAVQLGAWLLWQAQQGRAQRWLTLTTLTGGACAVATYVISPAWTPPLPDHYWKADGFALMKQSETKTLLGKRSPFGIVQVVEAPPPMHANAPNPPPVSRTLMIDSRSLCNGSSHVPDPLLQSEWFIGHLAREWTKQVDHAPRIGIVGLGCGVTLAATLSNARADMQAETIEINPVMPEATKLFEPLLNMSLDDPRHTLTIEDGFSFFANDNVKQYDAIIVDVAWMQNMNATHLFSQEMYRNIRRALTPQGLLIVWSEEYRPFSEVSQIIYRTIASVFLADATFARQEADGAVVFYATDRSLVDPLKEALGPESTLLTRWLQAEAADAPINTLDDLAMNRAKFTLWGDSTFDRLFEKYRLGNMVSIADPTLLAGNIATEALVGQRYAALGLPKQLHDDLNPTLFGAGNSLEDQVVDALKHRRDLPDGVRNARDVLHQVEKSTGSRSTGGAAAKGARIDEARAAIGDAVREAIKDPTTKQQIGEMLSKELADEALDVIDKSASTVKDIDDFVMRQAVAAVAGNTAKVVADANPPEAPAGGKVKGDATAEQRGAGR